MKQRAAVISLRYYLRLRFAAWSLLVIALLLLLVSLRFLLGLLGRGTDWTAGPFPPSVPWEIPL
ncbi:MAG: hypothetical protein DMG30_13100 [Acidobacteria bacterium]|nr:MAG: hypothetical protein DMG30_13100 [Acidobacteriota bacterium]